ncbi:hypothetical protein GCM10028808_00080 [Spirosoma migulaei]
MNVLFSFVTLSLVSQSLLAQPKPAARKPIPAKRPVTTQSATTPVKKPVATTTLSAAQPAKAAPVEQEQPRPEQPTTTYIAPKPQAAPANRPAVQNTPTTTSQSHFRIGFRLGGNSSTIGGTDISALGEGVKLARVTGFHGGVIVNIGGPNFSVQPEILYTQYGVRVAAGADYFQLKYNLVEVPILLKASFGQPNLRFFINAGPVAGYTTSGTISVQESGQSQSQALDVTSSGRLSFGASGGAGVALKAGPGSVQLEARYSYLFSSNEDGVALNPQNAMLSVGYLIPLGGK